jgi:hypothetical protein
VVEVTVAVGDASGGWVSDDGGMRVWWQAQLDSGNSGGGRQRGGVVADGRRRQCEGSVRAGGTGGGRRSMRACVAKCVCLARARVRAA